jgi:glycosyltransferase involved in cell wall biosynthesis
MKILITTVFEYPHTGGLSTHVHTLKKGLEERGHTVDVLSFSNISTIQQNLYARGPSFLLNKIKKGKGFVYSHMARKKLLLALISEAKGNGYDLINAQDVFATLASVESGIPTVSTVHGYMSFEAISKGSIVEGSEEDLALQAIEKQAYKKTGRNITVDQRIKDYLYRQASVEAVAIRNFIDISAFKPEKENKIEYRKKYNIDETAKVLFVPRRLTKKNGVILPMQALAAVLAKHPKTKLIYAGTGEEMATLKKMVADNNWQENVKLLGAVPHEQMKEYYALADVVLVPSVHDAGVEEATSISALEAMGSGSPLVASAIGGLKEIIEHEQDGLLVEDKNVDQLAASINRLLDDEHFGKQLAKAAREKIEGQYSHRAAAEKYETIYKSIL